jgi:hypothetical protein
MVAVSQIGGFVHLGSPLTTVVAVMAQAGAPAPAGLPLQWYRCSPPSPSPAPRLGALLFYPRALALLYFRNFICRIVRRRLCFLFRRQVFLFPVSLRFHLDTKLLPTLLLCLSRGMEG